jgi:hypothetical protein
MTWERIERGLRKYEGKNATMKEMQGRGLLS